MGRDGTRRMKHGLVNTLLSLFRPAELEHIPEREYARLIERATVRRGDAAWVLPLIAGLVCAAAWLAIGYSAAAFLSGRGGGRGGAIGVNWARIGVVNVLIALVVVTTVGAMVRWRLVTNSIKRLVNKAACPYCEFSLMGLEVEMGGVVCPECGERTVLSEIGLTKEDLVVLATQPFDGAGKLGSYSGVVPEAGEKKIHVDRKGEGIKRKQKASGGGGGGGGDVVI